MIGAFVGHLVGDYLIQNDWMGKNKKDYFLPLLVHVITYTMAIWLFTQWPLWALAVTALTHGALDGTYFVKYYCKFIGRSEFVSEKSIFFPWSWVVVDNSFHIVQLYLTGMFVAAC